MKILFVGPLRDFSGYASAARDYVGALTSVGCEVVTRNFHYDGGDYKSTALDQLDSCSAQNIDVLFQMTTPIEMEPKAGLFNVGAFCWETDRIPDVWVNQLNKLQLVLVPCQDNLRTARKCGVVTPVEVIPYTCDPARFSKKVAPYDFAGLDGHFKFLSIFQYAKKKGMDPLLKAYFSEFTPTDGVCLILKTYFGPNDGQAEAAKMQELIGFIKSALRLKEYPPLLLIHEVLSFAEVERLYKSAHCYCLPSRGEGWGVPHFDALGWGLPAIATSGTGPEEFITENCGWLVNSHCSPVVDMPHPHEFLYTARENWREPHVDSIRKSMREAFSLWDRPKEFDDGAWDRMCEAAKARARDFSYEKVGPQLLSTIESYYRKWKDV